MNETHTPHILIVDDQELIYRVLQATLRPLGARLSWVPSGEKAIEHLVSFGAPDAIVLDFSMPEMDGVETLRKIRELPSGDTIPVVMLTARDQTHIRTDAEGLQVHSFMTKPFSPNLLLSTIKQILNMERGA
jgi:putative two-component system response regulator